MPSKEEIPPIVAIYVRVSTQDQVEHGYSLERQVEVLKDECIKRGWRYRYIYKDEGVSGKDLERPMFQRMLQIAEMGRFNTLLVWKLDRLGRSNIDLQCVMEYLKRLDVKIVSYTEPFDATTVAGKFMFDMLASMAEWERSMIIERTRMGVRGRVLRGKWKGGPPPYGYSYDKEKGMIEIDKTEAIIIELIFEKYLELGTLEALKRYLNREKILTRRGNTWRVQTLTKMLTNPIYTGQYIVGDYNNTQIEELRIISDKTFAKAQKLKQKNKKIYHRLANSRKPKKAAKELAIYCQNCGHQLYDVGAYCCNCGAAQWIGDYS